MLFRSRLGLARHDARRRGVARGEHPRDLGHHVAALGLRRLMTALAVGLEDRPDLLVVADRLLGRFGGGQATAGKGVGDLPMLVKADVTVEQADGSRRTVSVTADFGQRREQGQKDADFYGGFVAGKMYALVAEQLTGLGLVSKGSAKRVQRANKGLPRSKWKWNGVPWKKRDLKDARVAEVTFTPMLKRVTVEKPAPGRKS